MFLFWGHIISDQRSRSIIFAAKYFKLPFKAIRGQATFAHACYVTSSD